jgi:hypothetical protein
VANGGDWKTCGFYKGPGEDFQILFTVCDDVVRGDTLKITILSNPNETDVLHVCEVEVYEEV